MNRTLIISAILVVSSGVSKADTITLNASADNRILSFDPNVNDNQEFLSVYNDPGNVQRTIIQFDYSSLAGKTVVSATLRLYGQSYSGSKASTTVDLYRVSAPWSETASSWIKRDASNKWTNQGGDAVGTSGGQMSNPYFHWVGNGTNTPTWFEFDATKIVTGALAGEFDNNGMLLSGAEGCQLSWVSREGHIFQSLDAAAVPQLVVETVPEPTTMIALGAGLVFLARRRK